MHTALKAGAIYFALIFIIGFVLGVVRIIIIVPQLGELSALLIELPIILTAAWLICGLLLRRFAVPEALAARMLMGGVAFVLLMLAEWGLAIIMGQSASIHFAGYLTFVGGLGLAGQLLFALFPLIRMRFK